MGSMPLTVALVSDTFYSDDGESRLWARLDEARKAGAELAVLPEIPLNPWSPASTVVREDDAEEPGGPRHRTMSAAARDVGIGLVGGAIVRDPATGRRHNRALVFDAAGVLVASYAKVHLPDEPGFHEPWHYEPGDTIGAPIQAFGIALAVQICSDINRPAASHALAAMGAGAIIHPRATESATYEKWKLVLRSTALTTCAYVLSVNRPHSEQGVPIGGPSLVVDPNGEVVLETTASVAVATIDETVILSAGRRYPGYLRTPSALYGEAWAAAGRKNSVAR
jgi:N-carbamoylputrescine amidase